jgi:hypothetical protein
MSVKESRPVRKQANSFAKRCTMFVKAEHGARSTKQAIAIGLSKARRAGVKLSAPKKGRAAAQTRQKAQRDLRKGRASSRRKPSATRSRGISKALKREGHSAASKENLGRQARTAAKARGAAARHQAGIKAVRTKRQAGLKGAAQKAARTRASHRLAA